MLSHDLNWSLSTSWMLFCCKQAFQANGNWQSPNFSSSLSTPQPPAAEIFGSLLVPILTSPIKFQPGAKCGRTKDYGLQLAQLHTDFGWGEELYVKASFHTQIHIPVPVGSQLCLCNIGTKGWVAPISYPQPLTLSAASHAEGLSRHHVHFSQRQTPTARTQLFVKTVLAENWEFDTYHLTEVKNVMLWYYTYQFSIKS